MADAVFGRRTKLIAAAVLIAAVSALAFAWFGLSARQHPQTAHFSEVATSRQTLADVFHSYDSVEKVISQLDKAELSWSRRGSRRPPSRAYPPRALDTLTIVEYTQLGEPGSLTLEFFNDRLFEAQFEPKDPDAYARKLHQREPQLKRDRNGRVERIVGDLRFASNTDLASSFVGRSLTTKPYAIWQDLRLVRERNDWDAKYGGIPYAAE